jgi:hypothetical protein
MRIQCSVDSLLHIDSFVLAQSHVRIIISLDLLQVTIDDSVLNRQRLDAIVDAKVDSTCVITVTCEYKERSLLPLFPQ